MIAVNFLKKFRLLKLCIEHCSINAYRNAAAFVTFTTTEGAASAFDDYNGKQIDDCPVPLQIGFAREKGKEDGMYGWCLSISFF